MGFFIQAAMFPQKSFELPEDDEQRWIQNHNKYGKIKADKILEYQL